MKKFLICALLIMACVTLRANDYVSWDRAIPTNKVVSASLSRTRASKPIFLNVWNAYPNNGTVTISYVHTGVGGLLHTNALSAITLVGGAVSTNIASLVKLPVFRGEPVYVSFSTATNGSFQLVGELWGD